MQYFYVVSFLMFLTDLRRVYFTFIFIPEN